MLSLGGNLEQQELAGGKSVAHLGWEHVARDPGLYDQLR